MQKMTMLNLCINFLNKAAKSLPILYDFAVAPLTGAWIKIARNPVMNRGDIVASFVGAWIKTKQTVRLQIKYLCRILLGCVELLHFTENLIEV